MLHALLIAALLSAKPAPSMCGSEVGWHDGRAGTAASTACDTPDYLEAYRLGDALRQLRSERGSIQARLLSVEVAEQNILRRRQRQIDTDLEAIRGVATIKGWPLDIPPELTP